MVTVFPFSYSQGKYLLWEGLWTNGRGDRNQPSHSHFFFFICLFLRPSPQRTCFCTMKKSFLYAAMPLLNWRLSAAVQLSDPEGGGGGGREGERGRDLKGGTCSMLMESLKTLKDLLLVYILNVQGSRWVLTHPDTLTAAAATALRRRLRGWGFILAELLADFKTNYERASASCVESIRWRTVRRQIRF